MVGETAKTKRGPFLAVILLLLMILLRTTLCGATTSIIDNIATSPYHALMDEPDDWMFDSEISRMLASKDQVTPGTKDPNKPVVDCGRFPDYKPCLQARKNHQKVPETCGHYKRKVDHVEWTHAHGPQYISFAAGKCPITNAPGRLIKKLAYGVRSESLFFCLVKCRCA